MVPTQPTSRLEPVVPSLEPVVERQALADGGLVRDAVRSPLCLTILAAAFVLTVLMLGLGSLLHPDADLGTFRLVVPTIALATATTAVALITIVRRRRQRTAPYPPGGPAPLLDNPVVQARQDQAATRVAGTNHA